MLIITLIFFYPIYFNKTIILSNFTFLNYLLYGKYSFLIKVFFSFNFLFSNYIIILKFLSYIKPFFITKNNKSMAPDFSLLIGKDLKNNDVYIPEKSLYQNILITGSIGSGKTSSAVYPFTKQLISYKSNNNDSKLAFLILDVKGNFYSKVVEFASNYNRFNDIIEIGLNSSNTYNPLNKPNLKSSVLANRLKTILLLFSQNNSESYWLDKVEQILKSFIDFCRLYNDNYVTFEELNNLVCDRSYFDSKMNLIRKKFINNQFTKDECYNLYHSIYFLNHDFYSLDSRTFNILKSEITRITDIFVSDYDINRIFCPKKENQTFLGFKDVIENGKIVVLNMNISEHSNLSKIIAAYLKLDFQSEVLSQLSNSNFPNRSTVFISDEYQEYVTSSDANFFAQSRESKCINIISTQSYTSLLQTLNNQNSAKVIIQNLINKLWFRCDDIYTIEDIQKQIGKEEKKKISRSISENSRNSFYNSFSKDFTTTNSNLSESINSYMQNEYKYDSNFFTQELNTFSCLSFLSNGDSILPPQKLNMIPYFANSDWSKNE